MTKKTIISVIMTFVICYAITIYWEGGANLFATLTTALMPFLTGAAIAYVVNIVMTAYETVLSRLWPKLKGMRALSLTLAYCSFIVALITLVSIVIPDLVASLRRLLTIDPSDVMQLLEEFNDNDLVNKLLHLMGKESDISSLISRYSQQLSKEIISILTSILTSVTGLASGLLNLFISLIFSIYVLSSKETLGRQATLLAETYFGRLNQPVQFVRQLLHDSFRGFIVGQTLEAIILGTLCSLGMLLFKLPYAGTVGILIAFTALIPVVGAYIGVTIGTILIMTQSIDQAIFFVIYIVILQQFEGNLIYPRVVGQSIGLPAIWVLLSISVGAALSGVFGMLVAVPLSATAYKLIRHHVYSKQGKPASFK